MNKKLLAVVLALIFAAQLLAAQGAEDTLYNRVSSYTDVNGFLLQYHYDANGNLTNLIYPGNKIVRYAYDALNRLTNIEKGSVPSFIVFGAEPSGCLGRALMSTFNHKPLSVN